MQEHTPFGTVTKIRIVYSVEEIKALFFITLFVLGLAFFSFRGAYVVRAEAKRERQRFTSVVIPPWEQAMARWNALYYCLKDDIVYVPGEGTFAPADQMRQYIEPPEEPPASAERP